MATYNGHNEDSSGNILLSIGNGMTATVETGSTASQAYTKGALLFFNNRLCKATKAISSGATLAVGTNLSQTSLGAELTSHLRSSDGKEFYFDVKDGTYGYYPSASKVSSEFVPFGGTPIFLAVSGYFNAGSFTVKSFAGISKSGHIRTALTTGDLNLGTYVQYFTGTLSLTGQSTITAVNAGTYEITTDYSGTEVVSEITLSAGGTFTIPNKNNFFWTIRKK
jgi:hypothetical protein